MAFGGTGVGAGLTGDGTTVPGAGAITVDPQAFGVAAVPQPPWQPPWSHSPHSFSLHLCRQ
jgi:hypothetical protein